LLHLFQAFLWRRVVIDVGAPPPDARTTVRVYFMAGLARFIPGFVWQFPAFALLGEQAGIPALAASAAGVIGNLAFLASGVVFLAFTLPGTAGVTGMLLGVLLGAAALCGVFLFTGSPLGARLRTWMGRHLPERLLPALELAGRIRPAHALSWTVGYGLSWLLLGVAFTAFVAAFEPGALAHFRALSGIMAAAYLAGYVMLFAPAGLGVREVTMAGLLAGVVAAPAAVLISVAQRLWFLLAEGLAFATFPLLPGRRGPAPVGGPKGRGKLMEVL
jgi:hypothetical protein